MAQKHLKALVFLDAHWVVEMSGALHLFKNSSELLEGAMSIAVPVTEFKLEDPHFVFIEFYPEALAGRPVQMYVPIGVVANIVVTDPMVEDPKKLGFSVGFRGGLPGSSK
jgi:hypothetical protein